MPAQLDGLIRVRKHALDQKQKFLAELYRQAEELVSQKSELLRQLDEEQEKVQEFGVEMLSYFGPYSAAVKERVEDIDEASATLDARIEAAREDMRLAFNEMKKLEITQERRDKAEQAALDKKEADELDAIAIEGFRRRAEQEE